MLYRFKSFTVKTQTPFNPDIILLPYNLNLFNHNITRGKCQHASISLMLNSLPCSRYVCPHPHSGHVFPYCIVLYLLWQSSQYVIAGIFSIISSDSTSSSSFLIAHFQQSVRYVSITVDTSPNSSTTFVIFSMSFWMATSLRSSIM